MKTLVVIPAYNEEETILNVVKEVIKYKFDFLVVNDCSTDNTKKILDDNRINHLDLPVNLGIAGVTQAGFKYAKDNNYEGVVCIDGDGQHLPSYINKLTEQLENGCDYVVGSRFVDEKKPISSRMIGSRLICFFIKIKTGKTVTDPTSGMRAAGKKIIEEFAESMNFYAEPDTVCYLINRGYKIKEVQVEMQERQGGESYFKNPFKSLYYMLAVLLSIFFIQNGEKL